MYSIGYLLGSLRRLSRLLRAPSILTLKLNFPAAAAFEIAIRKPFSAAADVVELPHFSPLPGARGRRMDIQTRIYHDVCVCQAYVMQTAEELEKDDRTSVQPKRTNERESAAAADSAAAAA